jgi:hypothetical protein
MDLPEPPERSPGETRAPVSGLKLMLLILVVLAITAGYGLREVKRRPLTEKATIIPAASISPSASPTQH